MNENDLLAALLGYGSGSGMGNYGYTGAPSSASNYYNPLYNAAGGYNPSGMMVGSQIGYLPGQTDPNTYGYIGQTSGQQIPTGDPYGQLGGGTPIGNMPAGNNKGGPTPAGNPGGPAGAPPAVGSPGWVSGHPDYKTNFLGGNAPAVGGPGWMGTHPNYQPGVAAVTRGDPAAPPTVGSPGWARTHPNYPGL